MRSSRRLIAIMAAFAVATAWVVVSLVNFSGTASALDKKYFDCDPDTPAPSTGDYEFRSDGITLVRVTVRGAAGSKTNPTETGAAGKGAVVDAYIRVSDLQFSFFTVTAGCTDTTGSHSTATAQNKGFHDGGLGGAEGPSDACVGASAYYGENGGGSSGIRGTLNNLPVTLVEAGGGGGGGGDSSACDAGVDGQSEPGAGGSGSDTGDNGAGASGADAPTGGLGGSIPDSTGGNGGNGSSFGGGGGGGGGGGNCGTDEGAGKGGSGAGGGGGGGNRAGAGAGGGASCVNASTTLVPASRISTAADAASGLVEISPIKLSATANYDVAANPSAGDEVSYEATLTNDGQEEVKGITASTQGPRNSAPPADCDPKAPAAVPAGETMTCTAKYILAQTDIDAGKADLTFYFRISDITFNARGVPVEGVTVSVSAVLNTETSFNATLSASINNLVQGPSDLADRGDRIVYKVDIENTGKTTLSGLTGTVALTIGTQPTPKLLTLVCTTSNVSPGKTSEAACTVSYEVLAADLDYFEPTFNATAELKAKNTFGATVSDKAEANTIKGNQIKSVQLTQAVSNPPVGGGDGLGAGDVIEYSITATNRSTGSLSKVVISQEINGTAQNLNCPAIGTSGAVVRPGDSVACTISYTVTQEDVDLGYVEAIAGITGEHVDTSPIVLEGPVVRKDTISGTAAIEVTAAIATPVDPAVGLRAGDTVKFTVTAKNIGGLTLNVEELTQKIQPSGPSLDPECPDQPEAASIAPQESYSCTTTHMITQEDVNSGKIATRATATARPGSGPAVRDQFDLDTPLTQVTTIALTLTAAEIVDGNANKRSDVGDVISYTVKVTNTGTVTLTGVTVSNNISTATKPTALELDCGDSLPATVAPGADITCKADHTIAQGDLDRGTVTSTAEASGRNPVNVLVRSSQTVDTTLVLVSSLEFKHSSTVENRNDNAVDDLGDVVVYAVTVKNTGNVTVTNVKPSETANGTALALACDPNSPNSLAPDQEMACTGSLAITQATAPNGVIEAVGSVTGEPKVGDPVAATANALRLTLGQASGAPAQEIAPDGTVTTVGGNSTGTTGTISGLASTGASIAGAVGLGVLAVAGGFGLLLLGWRRPDRLKIKVKIRPRR